MAIERLNQGTPAASSQVPIYDPTNGVDRRISITQLAELLQTLLSPSSGLVTQYAAPNATGFNVLVAPPVNGSSIYLRLTPLAGYAAGTVTLPPLASCIDGQELLVSCTQAVTTLTVAGNGATVNGAPTTLAANAFFRLRFDAVSGSWARVG